MVPVGCAGQSIPRGMILPIVVALLLALTTVAGRANAAPVGSPGALLAYSATPRVDPSLRFARSTNLRYVSADNWGRPVVVTGQVVTPAGTVPRGGWPVIAYGHGTTGIATECAPSSEASMFGNLDVVRTLVRAGFAVVQTDYYGLGGPGVHPYLNSYSHGNDVIYSVLAAQRVSRNLSNTVALYGASQGGRAVAAAAERIGRLAPRLRVVGVGMAVPALHLPIASAMTTSQLSASQYAIMPYLVRAVQVANPRFRADEVLHGDLLRNRGVFDSACTEHVPPLAERIIAQATPAQVRFTSAAAQTQFERYFAQTDLPQTGYQIPTFITRATDDDLVLPAWTATAVRTMCRLGISVTQSLRTGGHASDADVRAALPWLKARFAGKPATSSACVAA